MLTHAYVPHLWVLGAKYCCMFKGRNLLQLSLALKQAVLQVLYSVGGGTEGREACVLMYLDTVLARC